MKKVIAAMILGSVAMASAQTINLWRGGASQADWNDPYKWKLQHVPTDSEAVHFRQSNAIILINSTVDLDNGMMLYGRDLFLEGDGNLNFRSPITHKSTVNIPASATGQANLTLGDTLTLNGRIALAAKAFGTSANKGSVTLKDQTTISGILQIGNNGSGSGQVFIRDQATFRISGLELHTEAERGGVAEIHILGGTAHLETADDPFAILMEDSSRKIIVGENGTLRIDSDLPVMRKSELLSELISRKRIIAAGSCKLASPVIQDDMILLKADFKDKSSPAAVAAATEQPSSKTRTIEIEKNDEPGKTAASAPIDPTAMAKRKVSLESLLKDMRTNSEPKVVVEMQVNKSDSKTGPDEPAKDAPVPLAGYIVFVSALLLCMRPQKSKK